MTKKEIKALTPAEIAKWQNALNLHRLCSEQITKTSKALTEYMRPFALPNGLLPANIMATPEYKQLRDAFDTAEKKAKIIHRVLFGKKVGSAMVTMHQLETLGIIK